MAVVFRHSRPVFFAGLDARSKKKNEDSRTGDLATGSPSKDKYLRSPVLERGKELFHKLSSDASRRSQTR